MNSAKGVYTSFSFLAVSIADLRKFGQHRIEALLFPTERSDVIGEFSEIAELQFTGYIELPYGEDGERVVARQLLRATGYEADFAFFDVTKAVGRFSEVHDAIEIDPQG